MKYRLESHIVYSSEIISADSRQVYKGMDIGTGKDLEEYIIDGNQIPYHLIDIISPENDYSVYQFQTDFYKSYKQILQQNSIPILCGGTGLYIESVLLNYEMAEVNPDFELREKLENLKIEFVIKPYIRFKGQIGEQATMFFLDPSGNALEFKAFKNNNQLFTH